MLTESLIIRMRTDLTSPFKPLNGDEMNAFADERHTTQNHIDRKWIVYPKTLRITTRSRAPLNPDGTRSRSFNRTSKSCNMPFSIFNLSVDVDALAEKIVEEVLVPLFRRLHTDKSGWNLSLVNLCATNMSIVAEDGKAGIRDIGRMLRRQEDVLKGSRVDDAGIAPSDIKANETRVQTDHVGEMPRDLVSSNVMDSFLTRSKGLRSPARDILGAEDQWNSEDELSGSEDVASRSCQICGAVMPPFAIFAHLCYHFLPE